MNNKKKIAFAFALSLCALTVPFSNAMPAFKDCAITASAASSPNLNYSNDVLTVSYYGSDFCSISGTNSKLDSRFKTAKKIVFEGNNFSISGFKGYNNIQELDFKCTCLKFTGDNVFSDCTNLKTLKMSSKLSANFERGFDVFANCTSLVNVDLTGTTFSGNKMYTRMFENCTALESIVIPEGVVNTGSSTFSGCKSLKSISFPNSLTTIDGYSFKNCDSLTTLYIPEITGSIGIGAFEECDSLTDVYFLNGTKELSYNMFYNCPELKNVFIPASVEKVASTTFNISQNRKPELYVDQKCIKLDSLKKSYLCHVLGDANNDGIVRMNDALLIDQYCKNRAAYGVNGTDKTHITEQGLKNADVFNPGSGVTRDDMTAIQEYLLEIIPSFPKF